MKHQFVILKGPKSGQHLLVPWGDDGAKEWLQKKGRGTVVNVALSSDRNPKHHKKLMGLISFCCKSGAWRGTKDSLIEALKFSTGHTELRSSLDGKFYSVPKSISFGSMKQEEFEEFFELAILHAKEHLFPHMSEDELRKACEILDGEDGRRLAEMR